MKPQLYWGQKNFIKFEMEKRGSKKEKKQQLRHGFPNSIERFKRGESVVGNFA